MSNPHQQKGMALFQVLLIVAIIAVLLVIMSSTTQSQVQRAQALQQQTEKQLALHSAANYVDFLMLTNDWTDMRTSDTPISGLNYHSYPSRVKLPPRLSFRSLPAEIMVSFQNVRSLLNVNQANEYLRSLLQHVGLTEKRSDLLVQELQEQLYRPDAIYLQNVNELRNITGWTQDIIERIRPYVTTKRLPFNGAWAPDALLPVLLTSGQADTITALRQSGQYQPGLYEEFSGQETGFGVSLYPSQEQRVTISDPLTGEQLRRGVKYATHEKNPRTIEYKRYLREQRIELDEANPVNSN